jgi:hypothetical protein
MPILDTRYNITFLDALGQAPRVLPYEYFRNFAVSLHGNSPKKTY